MDRNDLPKQVYDDLLEQAETVAEFDTTMASSTPEEIFDRWLQWNGIIGWSSRIWEVAKQLQGLEP